MSSRHVDVDTHTRAHSLSEDTIVTFHIDDETQSSSSSSLPLTQLVDINVISQTKQVKDSTTTPATAAGTLALSDPSLKPAAFPSAAVQFEGSIDEKPIQFLTFEELAQRTNTSINFGELRKSAGLTQLEAQKRLLLHGRNELSPPKELPEIFKYLLNYVDPLMLLLQAAAWLAIIAYLIDTSQPLNMWLGIVIFIAVFISTTFSYVLEGRASAVMKGFKNMLPKFAEVIREGQQMRLSAAELVVGDIVLVQAGDQVPADIRVIVSADLKVEKSSLTGESLPITVTTHTNELRMEDAKNIIMNSSNALEGSAIGVVFATGDQTFIGRIAKLASATDQTETPVQKEVKLFVKKQSVLAVVLGSILFIVGMSRGFKFVDAFINSFIVILIACCPEGLPVTITSCLAMAAKAMAEKKVYIKQLRSVETLGSATVIASDKTGTLTQNKMTVSHLWFNNVTWNQQYVETDFPVFLPSQTYNSPPSIASLAQVGYHYSSYNALELIIACCSKARYEDHHDLTDEDAVVMERGLLLQSIQNRSLTLSNYRQHPLLASVLSDNQMTVRSALQRLAPTLSSQERVIKADASEAALIKFVQTRQSIELLRHHYQTVFEIPFNSRNKYALSIVKPHRVKHMSYDIHGQLNVKPTQNRILLMKGAPEVILSRCSHYLYNSTAVPIDAAFLQQFQEAYELFGNQGERVLGFAWLELSHAEYPAAMDGEYHVDRGNFPTSGLTFVGLVSLVDPPKSTVPDAVKSLRGAGLKVVMVTGDHPITAAAIARKVGIISPDSMTRADVAAIHNLPVSSISPNDSDITAEVIVGTEINSFTQKDWDRILSKPEIVFARTTPDQKLLIVENLQRLGEIVAVTGDGVNDSPALRKADIGVAMGINGSDVARDAAHVILLNDDFSSIVDGVRLGRTIFDNLAKTIAYTLTHLVPETIPVLISLAFDFPFVLTTLSIIAIDCGTELLPAISYADEPSEDDVMNRKPRNSKTDRLVSGKMAVYVLFIAGIIETIWSYFAFLMTMKHYDIPLSAIPWSRTNHWSVDSDALYVRGPTGCSMDNTNPDYAADCFYYDDVQQIQILNEAAGAYWFTLIMSQLGHLLICKSRSIPLFKHGVFNNIYMIFGVLFSTALCLFFIFTPRLNELLAGKPFPTAVWFSFLLSWASLYVITETRKWWSYKHRGGLIDRFFNW